MGRTDGGRRDGGGAEFVDRLYEAAVVPELWRGVLADFAHLAGARDAVLIATRDTSFNRFVVSSPEFEDLVRSHSEDFPNNQRTVRLLTLRHAGFIIDHDVFTQAEIDAEPVFQELLIPRGYGSGVGTAIFVPSGDAFIVHAEAPHQRGPVSRDVIARLDMLRPHFARAALLSARLEMQRVTATAKALELIGLPAGVLGHNGRLLIANAHLDPMMPDVVQDRISRVTLSDPAGDTLLAIALERLATAPHDVAVRSIPVKARGGWPPIIVHLIPIKGAAHDVFANAAAILVATPVVPKDVPTADVVQGLFDLTPAEAKLAALVAAGHPPRDAARRLGVTEGTARTTLKRVMAKTGLSRQAELVGLLSGAAVVARERH